MARIFISYSRVDEIFARQLAADLERLGADVWIDVEDIRAGLSWPDSIQEGLDVCEVMLVIISPESMASKNVADEWQYYVNQGHTVIPVLLRKARVHFQLHRLQYVDFLTQDYDTAFAQLHSELRRKGIRLYPLSPRDEIVPLPEQRPLPKREGQSRSRLYQVLGATLALVVIGAIVLLVQNLRGDDDDSTLTPTHAESAVVQNSPETAQPTLSGFELLQTAEVKLTQAAQTQTSFDPMATEWPAPRVYTTR